MIFVSPFAGIPCYKQYSVQISNTIFVDEDPTKNCADYPNPLFESYRDCDEEEMRKFVSSFDPPGLVPVWLSGSFENVTSMLTMSNFGKNVYIFIIY